MSRSRRVAGSQTRAVVTHGPGSASASTWVRSDGMSIRQNGPPDGWMSSNGPVWWLGSDSFTGAQTPAGVEWDVFGIQPPSDTRRLDDFRRWGGRPAVGYDRLNGQGVLAAITRATSIIVGPVVRTTWRIHQATSSDPTRIATGAEIASPMWLSDPQLTSRIPGGEALRPTIARAKRLGPHDFWRTLLTHAIWFGYGALMYVEDYNGSPLAGTLRIVHPCMWGWTSDGRYVLDVDSDEPLTSDEEGAFSVGGVTWKMRLLRGFAPHDDITPSGALTRSGLLLNQGAQMNRYLSTVMTSGVPSGVLKVSTPNFDQDDADSLRASWMKSHGGSRRSVAVLNSGVDFTPLQFSIVDADVVNAKGMHLVDIAHAFGLSASWLDASLGSGSNLTYANLSDRRRDLLDHALADWGRSVEDLVTALLPFGSKMQIDWSGYLNTDPAQSLAFVAQGLALGYMNRREVRDRLGLTPDASFDDVVTSSTETTTDTTQEETQS